MASQKYTSMRDTDALPTEYLLDGAPLVPRGDVSILFGEGEAGKGRLTHWMVKQVTQAGGTVVGAWPEDHANEQLRPRLDAAGLTDDELDRVINITRYGGGRWKLSADTTHDGHVPLLREEILPDLRKDGHDVRMLVLDPLAALIGWGSIQTNAGARRAVEPIQDLCQDTGIAAWIVGHTVKSGELQGSAGLEQVARVIYRLAKDKVDPTVRVLSVEKGNNLPPTAELRFTIQGTGNGNARAVILTPDEIERRQRAWRKPSYTAAVGITAPGQPTVTRPIGKGFTGLKEAQLACSADEAAPGPFLDGWKPFTRPGDTPDLRRWAASVTREDGTVTDFVIQRNGPEVINGGLAA